MNLLLVDAPHTIGLDRTLDPNSHNLDQEDSCEALQPRSEELGQRGQVKEKAEIEFGKLHHLGCVFAFSGWTFQKCGLRFRWSLSRQKISEISSRKEEALIRNVSQPAVLIKNGPRLIRGALRKEYLEVGVVGHDVDMAAFVVHEAPCEGMQGVKEGACVGAHVHYTYVSIRIYRCILTSVPFAYLTYVNII